MGHGHSHSGPPPELELGTRVKTVLVGFLVIVGLLAVAGVVWLWPSADELSRNIRPQDNTGVIYLDAKVDEIKYQCPDGSQGRCQQLTVTLTDGENRGTQADVTIDGYQFNESIRNGDTIKVVQFPAIGENGPTYGFAGVQRAPVLLGLLVVFLLAVFAVARLRGLLALAGLVIAGGLLLRFMLPAILVGKPGMLVALSGSAAILFVVLYVAHGISYRTSAALAGTLIGLGLTTGLGWLGLQLARLTGIPADEEFVLLNQSPNLDFRALFMVGIIVGGLGVLNDVTITQASAVWELRAAAPTWTRRQVFISGMRIGRDHIASTIYTIVFAYAGSALTVLLLLYFSAQTPLSIFNHEFFAGEAVRTLGSSIGLILAVPITTGIAALTVGPARKVDQHAHLRRPEEPQHAAAAEEEERPAAPVVTAIESPSSPA